MTTLDGQQRIGGRTTAEGCETFTSVDARTGQPRSVAFHEASPREVAEAAATAATAFRAWREATARDRAALLRRIATSLEARAAEIVAVADAETGLGEARFKGELVRTTVQLQAFADMLEEGSYVEAVIATADAKALPAPRPDVRRLQVPLGPVAVFTPSNFPLAFGVAGTDTASALAAGCPVVVKGHPAHPETSELGARAVAEAVAAAGAPPGVFSLLQGRAVETSRALVLAPEIEAVAFTGSHTAGRALFELGATRPKPIPVYAEMGSVNPLFIGPAALAARADEIAEGLASSVTLGTGQFCTKPGLAFVPEGESGRAFARLLADKVASRAPGVLLHGGIRSALASQLDLTRQLRGVETLTGGRAAETCPGTVLLTDAGTYEATPALAAEHFGPVTVVVLYPPSSMAGVAERMAGHLTASIHADAADHDWAAGLAAVLVGRVGRLVWNGYPTGVAITAAMQHGGPYPAATFAAHTSVGLAAVRRFLRSVAYQAVPDALLPLAVRDANPLGLLRVVDGQWTRDAVKRS